MGDRTGQRSHHRDFAIGLARAFGGAIIFALPMFMTMEMWKLGATMPPLRLAAFLVVFIPALVVTSYFAGFEPTFELRDDAVDALVAFAVGVIAATAVLSAIGVIDPDGKVGFDLGLVCIQAVPASVGALLAQSMLSHTPAEERKRRRATAPADVFLAALGALFLSFNLAPTDEIPLIAARATPWHQLALVIGSIAILEAFAYRMEFRGSRPRHPRTSQLGRFVRRTLVGYVAAMAVTAGVLWAFGRFDGEAFPMMLAQTLVLGLPSAIGAAAARLIL